MITEDAAEFLAALPKMQALIGLDLGTKTIGVALSDALLATATPTETLRRKTFTADAEKLEAIGVQREAAFGAIMDRVGAGPRPAAAAAAKFLTTNCAASSTVCISAMRFSSSASTGWTRNSYSRMKSL